MQNDPLSHGLWETTAPPAPPTSPLAGQVKADVVVVGCGYTGLSAALRLAEAGAKVVALEAVEIGFGGAGRNVGLVNAGMWVMPSEMLKVLGAGLRRAGADFARRRAGRGVGDDREISRSTAIPSTTGRCIAPSAAPGSPRSRNARGNGASAARRSKRSAPQRPRPASARDAYAGALLDMRAGTIQPLSYARGLARAAIAAGAAIHTQSPVSAAERTDGKWTLAAGEGTVVADWIAVATDAYGGAPWPQGRREQIRLPYFNFATQPLSTDLQAAILPGREGCWDTRTILSSFRFDRDGRLVFGSVGALRGTGLAVHRAWAERALRKLFPRVGAVRFEAQWYGMIGMTKDAVPRFHHLADNVVAFCGYNGRGIGPGTVFGSVLADHILGRIAAKDLPLPVTAPDAPALPALREAYYEAGAQIAHAASAWL